MLVGSSSSGKSLWHLPSAFPHGKLVLSHGEVCPAITGASCRKQSDKNDTCVAASTTSVLFKLCAKNSMCFLTHFSRVLAWWHPYYRVAPCSLQCPDGLWVQHQAAALLTHGFFPLSVPGRVRIHTHIHKEGAEDRHESLCWKQQSIFILPSLQRQSSTSALLGSGSTRRRAALGWRSLRLRERLSTFPYCILFSAQGI